MWEHSGAIVAACALAFSIATTVLGILQRLSTSQIKIELAAIELKLSQAITDSNNEIDERVDRQGRDFGETVQAIRAHINLEVTALRREITEEQKEVREIFVRRDSFEVLTSSIGKLGEKIEKRLERMEEKLNNKQERADS